MRILLILTVFALFGTGCVERRMTITSEPTGADVYVNNTWHGKTPMIFPFKHYGTYSIRLEAPDYEPLDAKEPIQAPFHQRAYVDFQKRAQRQYYFSGFYVCINMFNIT